MRVQNKIQKLGYFWLPSNENSKLPGLLNIEDGGNVTVELLGLLEKDRRQWDVDIILGDIEADGKITLVNCSYQGSKKYGHETQYKNLIKSEYIFIGSHFFTKDELLFNEFIFKVEGLNAWSGISGIKIEHPDGVLNPHISYDKPENIEIDIGNGFKLSLEFYVSKTLAFHALGANDHAEIHQDTYWKIYSPENQEFSNFFDIAKKITNLMIFSIDKPICIEKIDVKKKGINEICLNGKETEIQKNIQVFTNKTLHSSVISELHWNNMLFRYRDIGNINTFMNQWLEMYEVIDPSLDLYFSVKFSNNKYEKSQFLTLTQALDALFNRLNPKEEGIIFYNKLQNLFEVLEVMWSKEELEIYLKKIRDTRNYLTHYDKKKETKCILSNEYPEYINTLELLLQFYFLLQLDFKRDEIYKFLNMDKMMTQTTYPKKPPLESYQ